MSATVERHSSTNNGSQHQLDSESPFPLPLELFIEDPEIIRALVEYPEGESRNQYAIEAMKIGVLALRHVGGQVSADVFRREGDRLVGGLQKTFDQHKNSVQEQIESRLKEYFDPKDGRFTERVQRADFEGRRAIAIPQKLHRRRKLDVCSHAYRPCRPR